MGAPVRLGGVGHESAMWFAFLPHSVFWLCNLSVCHEASAGYTSDGVSAMPSDRAAAASSAMLCTSSLRMTFSRCLRTVSGLIFSRRAISLLVRPAITRRTTCVSRGRRTTDDAKKGAHLRRRVTLRHRNGVRNQLRAAEETQFSDDAGAMLADGEFGNAECIRDLLAPQSLTDLPKNLVFSSRESRHEFFNEWSDCSYTGNLSAIIPLIYRLHFHKYKNKASFGFQHGVSMELRGTR